MDNQVWIFLANLAISAIVGVSAAFVTIGKYKEKVDNLKLDHDKLDSKTAGMKTELDRLLEFKIATQKYIDSKLYSSGSPLRLSNLGQKLIKDSGFKEIFESVKDDLVAQLEQLNPNTQYEVQEKARALMDTLTDYEPFKPIEKYAFDNGTDLSQILRAGAILLRDYYFEKHPEIINPSEQY
jgi:hypothetical protein